jgi:hypothetical protein
MVPPQEPTEYLYELCAIVDVKERCETSEVHPPALASQQEANVHPCEVEATNATNVGNTKILNQEALD